MTTRSDPAVGAAKDPAGARALTGPAPARSRQPGPLLTTGVPLGVSLVLHACLLAIAAAVVWRVTTTQTAPPPRVPVQIVFEAPGQSERPRPRIDPTPAPEAVEEPEELLPPPAPAPAAETAAAPPDLGGLSSGGPALPSGLSAPSIAGATPSPEALAHGASVRQDPIRFAGLGAATARSVVYVVDGSGPMVSSLEFVLAEVLRSVSRLGPSQRFGVVIFRRAPGGGRGPGYEWFTPALVRATPDAVRRLEAWLSRIEPRGASNPLDGLRAAFTMKPEAIFLLSRSIERSGGGVWQLGLESTLRELEGLNPVDRRTGTRPVVIKTIQFLDEDPSGIMQEIGRLHGGAAPGQEATDSYTVIRRASDLRKANDEGGADPAPPPVSPPN